MRSAWPRFDGFANVEAEAVGRHHAGGELTCVERDVDLGVDGVEVVEHEHLGVVLGHGAAPVFGAHEVDADDVGVGARRVRSRGASGRRPAAGGKPRRT